MPTSLGVTKNSGRYYIATLRKKGFHFRLCHGFGQAANVKVGALDGF